MCTLLALLIMNDQSKGASELTPQVTEFITQEESVCNATVASIDRQLIEQSRRFERERIRARDLTGTLVSTRRDEERAQVASDEAVSHALAHQHDDAIEVLSSLREKPYFGRVVLEEEDPNTGDFRTIEYKIGYASNSECRIIDWKKAPLSKLYYEYKEGEEYCEVIQGREREGRVALRNRVEIKKAELVQVEGTLGSFTKVSGTWRDTRSAKKGGGDRDFGSLPDVLSLITPEQFTTITHDSAAAVLLQGVAGSGKTTVALHRLAWLLAQQDTPLLPHEAVILTLGPSLSVYIKSTLPRLGIQGVPVFSFREWSGKLIANLLPASLLVEQPDGSRGPLLSTGLLKPPAGIERVKRSVGLLKALEEKGRNAGGASGGKYQSILDLLVDALRDPARILALDDSKLLSEKVIYDAYQRTSEMVERGTLDRSDFSLLLRAAQLLGLVTDTKTGASGGGRAAGPFKHVVIDEVQDYSPIELATVLSTLTTEGSLTLVGDVSQRTEDGFPGWKKLQGWWAERKRESSFVKLEVSHRCTKEIMRCASLLGDPSAHPSQVVVSGRSGKKPRWLIGEDQEQALSGLIDWLTERAEEAPNALLAVVCFSLSAARDLRSLLEPKFGASVRMMEDGNVSFEEGILLGEASSLKGLEFFGVVLWEPTNKALPPGEIGSNLLYVACTRAQEHLAFVTTGRVGTPLGRLSSSILQRVELEPIERSEEEENPFAAISLLGDEEKSGSSRRSNREE